MASSSTPGKAEVPPLKYRILTSCILFCCSAAGLIWFVTLVINDLNAPPAPSISLLPITAAGTNFKDINLTCVFSISSRNKAPVTYSHFQVTGRQDGPGIYKGGADFITTSATSVQSLEQSGPSMDTIAFDLPHSRVVIRSWYSVQNNNNESIRTGFSVLDVMISFYVKYVHASRRSTRYMFAHCRGPNYPSSRGHALLAVVVVNSTKDLPELNFTSDVFKCDVSRFIWIDAILVGAVTFMPLMLFCASISGLKE